MTVINTNVAALTARTYAVQANDKMQTSMERLSSGLRINSAADDAAGMAVANKMESQLRGMNAAIRNSQDGISLVQTAEAGMSEITNMIIRMRELAVQMNNGVYSNADRKNAQLEVTALLAEVDKIADNTAFNNVKVLNGTYAADIRAGNTNAESISVTIDSAKTTTLGATSGSADLATSTATGTRTDNLDNSVTSTLSVKESAEARIDLSTKNAAVSANGYTATHSLTKPDGSTWAIRTSGDNVGQVYNTAAVTFDADTASNNEVALTVTSSLIKTTNAIAAGDYTSGDKTDNSGVEEWASTISVEEAHAVTLAKSTALGAESDALYFAKGSGNDEADFTLDADTGALTYSANSGKLSFDTSDTPDNSLTVKLKGYNFNSSGTNAITEVDDSVYGTGISGNDKAYSVEGTHNTVTLAVATDVASYYNTGSNTTPAVGAANGGYSVGALTGIAGASVSISNTGVVTIANVGLLTSDTTVTFTTTFEGDVQTNTVDYSVTINSAEQVAEETINMTVTQSAKASETIVDTIALKVVANNDHLGDVDVATSLGAARAVTILDKALDEMSSSQAKLGAIQNRLQHNIDNLTTGAMLTQTARGRITDADFASETSELSKQQILGQAATAMLAQANQSKQSILSLLQ